MATCVQAGSLTWYEQFSTALSRMLRINDVQLACLLTVIVLAEIAGFIVGFLQNDHGPLFGVLGWSYPVAKGAARGVQVRPPFPHLKDPAVCGQLLAAAEGLVLACRWC